MITTYFFDDSEHLNSFYIRDGEQTHQFWTLTYVPGERLLETDLYVLTRTTFSGQRNLLNLKIWSVVIVGETIKGGGSPGILVYHQ
ncbi:MAG: hypothetical protein R2750_08650 [Bacteroidales bacterium]